MSSETAITTISELEEVLGPLRTLDDNGRQIVVSNDELEAVLGFCGKRKNGRPASAYGFWSKIDWNKPLKKIIEETGRTYSSVYKWSRVFDANRSEGPDLKITEEEFKTLTNVELQRKYRISYGYLLKFRTDAGLKTNLGAVYRKRRNNTKKDAILEGTTKEDWKTNRDIDLARKFGVEREYVRQLRTEFGVEYDAIKSEDPKIQTAIDGAISALDLAKAMTTNQFAKKYDLTYSQAAQVANRVGFSFSPLQGRFATLNFNLGSCILARIYGVRTMSVESYRKHRGIGGAKWHACYSLNNPEFREAVEAELKKAGSKMTIDDILAKTRNNSALQTKEKWKLKTLETAPN